MNKQHNIYLKGSFYVSLYNSEGDLIVRSELDQSVFYRARSVLADFLSTRPAVSHVTYEAGSLAFQAGQDYVEKFYPHLLQQTKKLYSGKPFQESNRYIFARNWNKAIELLQELVRNKDTLIVERAKHNLKIVNEAAEAEKK